MESVKSPGKITISLSIATSILIALVLFLPYPNNAQSISLPEKVQELLVKDTAPIPPFELMDHQNKLFNGDRLIGKWTLIFFGYTHCPDVCPTTLTEIDNAASRLKHLNTGSNEIQYVFVSIDPERDKLDMMADYISYFGTKFIAVSGEHKQLKIITNALNIKYQIGIGFNNEYIVNHSSAVLLINPEGRYYARFEAPHYAEELVADFKSLKKYYSENN